MAFLDPVDIRDALRTLDDAVTAVLTGRDEEVNLAEVASAWEKAGVMRPQVCMMMARRTRKALIDVANEEAVIESITRFAYSFMGMRQTALLFDALSLALCREFTQKEEAEASLRLITIAGNVPGLSRPFIDAAISGASGRHYYDPERVLNLC